MDEWKLPRIPPHGFWASLQSSQAKALLWWARSGTWPAKQRNSTLLTQNTLKVKESSTNSLLLIIAALKSLKWSKTPHFAVDSAEKSEGEGNLDASGVRSFVLGIRTRLQRFVKMVDGLAGGVLHRQQALIRHPAAIIRVHLKICWGGKKKRE